MQSTDAVTPAPGSTPGLDDAVRALKPAKCAPGMLGPGARPDPHRWWIPEHLSPLHGTAGYERLSGEQRLRYNQHHALHAAEQFIWIEQRFLIAPSRRLLAAGQVPAQLRRVLESLVADEESHNAVFWDLLAAARPDRYREPAFRSFSVPAAVASMARWVERCPRLLCSWLLVAGYFEERSIFVSREYGKAGDRVDPVFAKVYALHAQDEARHCALDRLLADRLVAGQGPLASRLNGWFLAQVMTAYHDPRWGFDAPIRALVRDHPELETQLPALLDDALIARGLEYQRGLFAPSAVPMTDRNRTRYAMLDSAIRRFD
jgi:hypothetical protein